MSDTQPGTGRKQAGPGRLALIAEATKRAGLIWITVPGPAAEALGAAALGAAARRVLVTGGRGRSGTSGATPRTC